jgi:hypothetical protein
MAHRGEGDYRTTLLKIADSVVQRALEGDREAWQEIAQREDGKPRQDMTMAGDEDGGPIRHEFVWKSDEP